MKEVFLPQTDIDRWMDIADFPNEIWKDVIGFEDAFQVSNLGRIKRKAFNFNIFNGVNSFRKAHIVKPQLRVGGYYHVSLSYKGKVYTKLIHRLVAMAFIPNPCNLPQVNHKDENPSNNCIDNLEWCDQKYNSNYGTNGQRISSKLTNGLRSKAVEQYDNKRSLKKVLQVGILSVPLKSKPRFNSWWEYKILRHRGASLIIFNFSSSL